MTANDTNELLRTRERAGPESEHGQQRGEGMTLGRAAGRLRRIAR